MPIRLVSEVNGNVCKIEYFKIWFDGVLRCNEDRDRLITAKPTNSDHLTNATCDHKISILKFTDSNNTHYH